MSHIPFVLLAYLLNGVSVTIDKVMLTKHIPDPLIYIFYFSAFSSLALLVLPFTQIPTLGVFLLASSSTLIWTSGAYFMFKGLQIGQVSRVIPVIGALVPIFLTIYYGIFTSEITSGEFLAVIFLILGLISIILPNLRGKLGLHELKFEIASALLFALSYIILREAYLNSQFLTVLVWSRLILIPVGILILIIPSLKIRVFQNQGTKLNFFSKSGILFLSGQAAGGISELLLTYSISLANPALVNSLQGVQYVFLFLATLFLAKKFPDIFSEKPNLKTMIFKVLGIILIGVGLYLLAFMNLK